MPKQIEPGPSRRQTRQQAAIWDFIVAAARPLRAEEIFAAVSPALPKMSISTVYRAIQRGLAEKQLVEVNISNQPCHYELTAAAAQHHHHFCCHRCDKVYDLNGCVEGLKKMLPKGFKLIEHEITLSGTCAACN